MQYGAEVLTNMQVGGKALVVKTTKFLKCTYTLVGLFKCKIIYVSFLFVFVNGSSDERQCVYAVMDKSVSKCYFPIHRNL